MISDFSQMVDEGISKQKDEKAKDIAAGTLGSELSKFPLRFTTSVTFSEISLDSGSQILHNRSATLLDLGNGPIAVTCFHVISRFRKLISEGRRIQFQIGNLPINLV